MRGRTACDTCTHIASFHVERAGDCRVDGCTCVRFTGGELEEEADKPEIGPRRITVDVPDGFMVTFSLVPYSEAVDGS